MSGLNLAQPPLHLVAVFQTPRRDGFLEAFQRRFHAVGKSVSDCFLFFLATRSAAQNVSLLALRNGHLLNFNFRPDLRPVFLQQFRFKLLHLTARRARQILPVAFADCRQVLFAHNAAVKHPDPARLAILAFHHAQNRLHRRDVGSIAVESFVAEWESFVVHNQRDHQLLAIWPVIARVTAAHHWILLRRAFHIRAGQVVEQHIELGAE